MNSGTELNTSHLRIMVDPPEAFDYSRLLANSRVGIAVSVINQTNVPAQFPFFCVMDLGLNLEIQRDWDFKRIASDGRRLLRYTYQGSNSLMPGEKLTACWLILKVAVPSTIFAAFGSDSPVALENLKDLRLFTVTGAANFPAQRGTLQVPVDAMRRNIVQAFTTGNQRVAV